MSKYDHLWSKPGGPMSPLSYAEPLEGERLADEEIASTLSQHKLLGVEDRSVFSGRNLYEA